MASLCVFQEVSLHALEPTEQAKLKRKMNSRQWHIEYAYLV